MWTRVELKSRATDVLRKVYWMALIASLIITIGGFGFQGNTEIIKFNFNSNSKGGLIRITPYDIQHWFFPALAIGVIIILVILGLILFRVLLGYHLEVGGRRFFIKAATEKNAQLEAIGFTFKDGRYGNVTLTMLYKGFLIFLWSLLLIIPGIIKSYAYRMVPYILAENPQMNYKRALELSDQMTDGMKFDILVLDLSFIGWHLLGVVTFGIGSIFINPYIRATDAELYLSLKERAIKMSLCSPEEFVGE